MVAKDMFHKVANFIIGFGILMMLVILLLIVWVPDYVNADLVIRLMVTNFAISLVLLLAKALVN